MQASNKPLSSARLVLGAPASSRRVEGAKENHVHPSNHAQSPLSLSLVPSPPLRLSWLLSLLFSKTLGSVTTFQSTSSASMARGPSSSEPKRLDRLEWTLTTLAASSASSSASSSSLSLSLANCETLKMREESQVM